MTGRHTLAGGLALAMLLAAVPLAGQGGDGYLFKEPRVSVSLRLGYEALMGPRSAGGSQDIFGFTQDLLTIGEGDHDALVFGGEVAVRLSSRMDVLLDISQARSEIGSEFRDWVDGNDLPIQQTTTFTRRPANLSLRYFLVDRGRRVSQFAWVPREWVPYVGAGAGLTFYEFEQNGDFVDFDSLEVFFDRLDTSGRTLTAHVLAGIQYSVTPQFVLTGEGRYRFGSGELRDDFVGFDNMDLSGLHLTVGLGVRF